MEKKSFDLPHEVNNVVVFPSRVIENNSARCSSSKPDVNLIRLRLLSEITKLDVLCEEEMSGIPTVKLQNAIAERADALKVILVNMRLLK